MSFCEHCQGQRFDRARVLRALRDVRQEGRRSRRGAQYDRAIVAAIDRVRTLDLPHLEVEPDEGMIVH